MSAMASQITILMIVFSTVYSGTYERKHLSSASLAFVRGIHQWPVNFPHKGPVTRKMFPFDDVFMDISDLTIITLLNISAGNSIWALHVQTKRSTSSILSCDLTQNRLRKSRLTLMQARSSCSGGQIRGIAAHCGHISNILGLNSITQYFQMIFSNAFSGTKLDVFLFQCRRSVFVRVHANMIHY